MFGIMKIFVLLTVCLAGVYSQAADRQFLVERGGNVLLECTTETVGRCTLINSKADIMVDRHSSEPRFHIVDNKTCNFNITNVEVHDSDIYKCTTDNTKVSFNLEVFVTPQEPFLKYQEYVKANNSRNMVHILLDKAVQLECHSNGGYPNATINWFVDNALQSGPLTNTEVHQAGDVVNVVSRLFVQYDAPTYSFDAPAYPNEKTIRCEVEHPAYDEKKVVLRIVGTDKESTELECLANGLPTPEDFNILRKNDGDDNYTSIKKEAIINVTTPGIYRCEARNKNELGDVYEIYQKSPEITVLDPGKAAERVKKSNTGQIIGIVFGTILAIAIVILIVAFLYRKEKLCFATQPTNAHFNSTTNPGNVENGVKTGYENTDAVYENTGKDQKKDGVKDGVNPTSNHQDFAKLDYNNDLKHPKEMLLTLDGSTLLVQQTNCICEDNIRETR
uniref:Ig-like domain-containing protein n=1 Tax=Strigamia maritima TaxID=126957 RepID=T1JAQ7_STRMM